MARRSTHWRLQTCKSPTLVQAHVSKNGKTSLTLAPDKKVHGKFTRKAPAAIQSDSKSEDEPLATSKAHSADADVDSTDSLDNREDEELEDELEMLDAASIKQTLVAERPSFATKSLNNPEDSDKDLISAEVDSSKCAKARQAEVPKWVDNKNSSDTTLGLDITPGGPTLNGTTRASVDYDAVNAEWPVKAHYVLPQSGARTIPVTQQPHSMCALINAAINQTSGDAVFIDAYPSPTTINDHFCEMLIDLANNLDFESLSLCLQSDSVLLDHLSRVLSNCLSSLCCAVKKITSPKVESSFKLEGTVAEHCEKVKSLITGGTYIYPQNNGGLIYCTKPYHHPMIISTLRECFFSAVRESLASRHASRFKSSIKDGPLSKELELPMAMVAMVATATYATLNDWNTGYFKKSKFNADAYKDVYRGHELVINDILAKRPHAYHCLMADLYSEVV
ncbi:hypothetical protein C0991_004153, partial [Blastosporella zonata]